MRRNSHISEAQLGKKAPTRLWKHPSDDKTSHFCKLIQVQWWYELSHKLNSIYLRYTEAMSYVSYKTFVVNTPPVRISTANPFPQN